MKINWKVRFKNPMFYVQILASILMPILAYMGLTVQDITTWQKLAEVLFVAVSNPYVLALVAVNIYNAVIDPTSTGMTDSAMALMYNKPNDEK